MPVHQPFYDREWIAVLPGPVTIDGQTHEYVSFVKGGVPKEVWFDSTDGVTYTQVTSKDIDRLLSGAETQGPLPAAPRPDSDWVQPITNSGMTQLGAGDLLASPDFFAGWSLLEAERFTGPPTPSPMGRIRRASSSPTRRVASTTWSCRRIGPPSITGSQQMGAPRERAPRWSCQTITPSTR
jgi:hypothetical protein